MSLLHFAHSALRSSQASKQHLSRLLLLQQARNLQAVCVSMKHHSLDCHLSPMPGNSGRRTTPLHTLLPTCSHRLGPCTIFDRGLHKRPPSTSDGIVVYKYTSANWLWWMYRLACGSVLGLLAVSAPAVQQTATQLPSILMQFDSSDPACVVLIGLTFSSLMMLGIVRLLKLLPIALRYNEDTGTFTARLYTWYLGEEKFSFVPKDVSGRTHYGKYTVKGRTLMLFDSSFLTAKYFNILAGNEDTGQTRGGGKQRPKSGQSHRRKL